MRDAQIAMVRDLMGVDPEAASTGQIRRVAMSYSRIVELRARQVAHERRKNRGISYLEDSSGPVLKLPPHIAREFMRARNKRVPVLFKEKSQSYFRQLWRDMSR